jgi:hypothetical protein
MCGSATPALLSCTRRVLVELRLRGGLPLQLHMRLWTGAEISWAPARSQRDEGVGEVGHGGGGGGGVLPYARGPDGQKMSGTCLGTQWPGDEGMCGEWRWTGRARGGGETEARVDLPSIRSLVLQVHIHIHGAMGWFSRLLWARMIFVRG